MYSNSGHCEQYEEQIAPEVRAKAVRMVIEYQDHIALLILQGSGPNAKEIGAPVTIIANGKTQTHELLTGRIFTACDPTQQIIGIGDESTIEQIRIVWPNKKVTKDNNVTANRSLLYSRPDLQNNKSIHLDFIQQANSVCRIY